MGSVGVAFTIQNSKIDFIQIPTTGWVPADCQNRMEFARTKVAPRDWVVYWLPSYFLSSWNHFAFAGILDFRTCFGEILRKAKNTKYFGTCIPNSSDKPKVDFLKISVFELDFIS